VRPLNEREAANGKPGWRALPTYNAITQLDSKGEPVQGATYSMDNVFDTESNTKDLYSSVCMPVVANVVKGINGTIFAYGQTSSGKTFTMQGAQGADSGVLQLAAETIFAQIQATPDREFKLSASYLEIYNENLRDLLSTDPAHIREDPRRGLYLECHEMEIRSFEEIQACLKQGEVQRTTGATNMNLHSSRSHAIFRLTIESSSVNEHGETSVRSAALNLVDLAGSESVRNTGATGQRAKEGGKINQSLLTLSRVITQLGDKSCGHINFRDSKLTRLLQNNLMGNATMAMICCVTPAAQFMEETRSTLQFASRAKNVKLNPEVNEVLDEKSMVKKLKREIAELRAAASQNGGGAAVTETPRAAAAAAAASGPSAEDAARIAELMAQVEKYEKMISGQFTGGSNKENDADGFGGDADDADSSGGSGGGGGGGGGHGGGHNYKKKKRQRETWCPGARGAPLPLAAMQSPSTSAAAPKRRVSMGGAGASAVDGGETSGSSGLADMASSGNGGDFQIPALEAMLEKKGEELAAAQDEIAQLKDEIAQLKAAAEAEAAEYEATMAEQIELYEELEKDQLELVAEAKAKDAEHEAALEAAVAEATEAARSAAKAEAEAATEAAVEAAAENATKRANDAAAMKMSGVQEDLSSKTAEAAALAAELEALQEHVEALEGAKDDADTHHAALLAEVEELRAAVAAAEEASASAQELEAANDAAKAAADARAAALEEKLAACKADLEASKEAEAEFAEALADKEAEAAAELAAAKETLATAEAAQSEADERVAALTDEVERRQAAEAEVAAAHEVEMGTLVEELEAAKATDHVQALVAELDAAKAELEGCKAQLAQDVASAVSARAVEADLARVREENGRVTTELTARDASLKEVRGQLEAAEAALQLEREQRAGDAEAAKADGDAAAEKQAKQQEARLAIMQSELGEAQRKLGECEDKLKAATQHAERDEARAGKELEAMAAKVADFEELSLRCRNLEAAVGATEKRAKAEGERAADAEANAAAAADAADKLQGEVEALAEKLEAAASPEEAERELERLRESEADLVEEARSAREDKKSLEERLRRAVNENNLLRNEGARSGELQEALEAAEQQAEELQAALEEKDAALSSLEVEKAQVQSSLEEAAEAAGAVQQLEVDAAEANAARGEAEAEAQRLGGLLALAEGAAEAAKQQAAKQGEQMMELAQQCQGLEEEGMDLSAKLGDAEERAAASAAEAGDLREALAAKQAECDASASMLTGQSASAAALDKSRAEAEAARARTELNQLKTEFHAKLEAHDAQLREKDSRIAALDKVKFTTELQNRFTKIIAEKADGKKVIKRLEAELEGLRSQVTTLQQQAAASAASSSSSSLSSTPGGSIVGSEQYAQLQAQLQEAMNKNAKIEQKLRQYVEYARDMEAENGAAKQVGQILRVAQRLEAPPSIDAIPEMAIDLCKKLNEAEGVAANVDALRASVGTLEATVARLRDEKSTLELAVAEGASRLEAERKTCAELEDRVESTKSNGAEDAAELSGKLAEKTREVKYLTDENLNLIYSEKELKKQAAQLRAELEALYEQTKSKAPGSLNLTQPSPQPAHHHHHHHLASSSSSSGFGGGAFSASTSAHGSSFEFGSSKHLSSAPSVEDRENSHPLHGSSNSLSAKKSRRRDLRGLSASGVPSSIAPSAGAADDTPDECKQS
jgi:centromeric protein E